MNGDDLYLQDAGSCRAERDTPTNDSGRLAGAF
jgi:hypothetical protein